MILLRILLQAKSAVLFPSNLMLLVLGVYVGHPRIRIIFSPPCFFFHKHQQAGSAVIWQFPFIVFQ